jgi:SAM-dependent methyltransferase
MNATRPDFDGLARIYRALEWAAFGRDLERARFCLLDRLAGCRDILLLGEGDGRCVERLARLAPEARLHCVEASSRMIARARQRLDPAVRARVSFEHADAFAAAFPAGRHDAVVTLFFLDCFRPEQVERLVAQVHPALTADAPWLWADFAVPARGWRRWRARFSLQVLYGFFRWQTGLPARALPPAEAILRQAGFVPAEERAFQGGFVRTVLFRPGASGGPALRPSGPAG